MPSDGSNMPIKFHLFKAQEKDMQKLYEFIVFVLIIPAVISIGIAFIMEFKETKRKEKQK